MKTNLPLFLLAFVFFSCGPAEPDPIDEPDPPRADPYFPSHLPEGFSLEDFGATEIVQGESESLTFVAQEDDNQFFIAIDAETSGVVVVVLSAIAPDGREYVVAQSERDEELAGFFLEYAGPATSENRVIARPRAVSAMIPNTPALSMQAGTWTFRVGAGIPEGEDEETFEVVPLNGSVRVGVVTRQAPPINEGSIDIVMSFHSSSGLDAEGGQVDIEVQDALQKIEELYGAVGIHVGNVSYLDLNESLPSPIDLGSPSCSVGDIEEVLAKAEPVTDAVHFIFVGGFTCLRLGGLFDAGANLAAVSNGIPAVPFSQREGIIVSTALKEQFSEDWAYVLGHELGHYLGLFHTVEPVADVFDNIDDTLEDVSENYLMHFQTSADPIPFSQKNKGKCCVRILWFDEKDLLFEAALQDRCGTPFMES